MTEQAEVLSAGRTKAVGRTEGIVLGLLIAVWIVLTARHLGYLSFWMDEGFHFLAADGILKHGYPLYPSGHTYYKVALYSYVLALAAKLFGLTAATLRAVSLVSIAGVIGLAYFVGRRFFSRTVGALAAVLLAFSVWEVEIARLALYFAPLQLLYLAGLFLFYRAYIEDRPRLKPWTILAFVLIPLVHQLGMGLIFCFPALLIIRGWKRFWRKDAVLGLGVVTLAYLAVQLHEYFFWKVGYVYEKGASTLGGMIRYFFSSFNFDYFKEFFGSFPLMSLVVLGGIFLYLGLRAGRGDRADPREREPWLYLILCLVFPLLFFGVFRTHVQPRYLAQLYPVFVLLFLASLREVARPLADLLLTPFAAPGPKARRAAAFLLFLGLTALLTEGVGPGRVRDIVERRYGDRITTDTIARSGRFAQEDNANPGLYVRHFLRPDDIVIAIHVVFQKIYAGRVDYWLWSGGPGTWDAWENTSTGWRDFYVGARWLNNLADLKKVIEGNPGRRVWLIGSTSLARRDHINSELAGFLDSQSDKRVFRGWDGVSQVFLWNDAGATVGPAYGLEGESLPVRRGTIGYGRDASRGAWMAWSGERREDVWYDWPEPLAAGRYRLRVRFSAGPGAAADGPALAAIDPRSGAVLRVLRGAGGDGLFSEAEAVFALERPGPLRLRWKAPQGLPVRLDWIDVLPAGEKP